MKPLFVLAMFLSSFFTKTSYATDIVSAKALQSFQNTFVSAKEASWTVTDTYYKVQFILNDQTLTAFYNQEGSFVGVTRNISSFQLPIILQTELKKDHANEWITELFEMSHDNGTDYYITLENADNKTILKSSNNSTWSVYKKLRKS
jgi:hypothetical protein